MSIVRPVVDTPAALARVEATESIAAKSTAMRARGVDSNGQFLGPADPIDQIEYHQLQPNNHPDLPPAA